MTYQFSTDPSQTSEKPVWWFSQTKQPTEPSLITLLNKEPEGTLSITVLSGREIKNIQLFGQQDPYIIVQYYDKKYLTKVDEDAGSVPVWNKTFEIPIYSAGDEIHITCMDRCLFKDQQIGKVSFVLSKHLRHQNKPFWLKIYNNEQVMTGEVQISLNYDEAEEKEEAKNVITDQKLNMMFKRQQTKKHTEKSHQQYQQESLQENTLQKTTKFKSNSQTKTDIMPLNLPQVQSRNVKDHENPKTTSQTSQSDSKTQNLIGKSILNRIDRQRKLMQESKANQNNQSTQDIQYDKANGQGGGGAAAAGKVSVQIINAIIYSGDDNLASQQWEPKLIIIYNSIRKETKPPVKKGSTPIWNYNFSIEVQSLNDKIKIKCIEESLPNKGFIGETILSISSLISSDNWIPLYDNKAGENSQKTAEVHMKAKFKEITEKEYQPSQFEQQPKESRTILKDKFQSSLLKSQVLQGLLIANNNMNIESRNTQNQKSYTDAANLIIGGVLELKIIEGKINKAKYEVEGDDTPCFVQINYNLLQYKTRPSANQKGANYPLWNHKLKVPIKSTQNEMTMYLIVNNSQAGQETTIGKCESNIQQLREACAGKEDGVTDWFTFRSVLQKGQNDGKPIAQVSIRFKLKKN